jgi:hypothetical protein
MQKQKPKAKPRPDFLILRNLWLNIAVSKSLKISLPEEEWFQYRPKVDKTHHTQHFSTGPILPSRDQSLWL